MSGAGALRAALLSLSARESLSAEQARAAMAEIMAGDGTPALIAAFLVALRVKGETVDEVVGAARAMRANVDHVHSARRPLVDTSGTGGDGAGTFNISTAVALVCAGAGAAVAKHGNRAASGRFGGADVLEALGVAIDLPAAALGRCIDDVGMAFLFAPRLHPAMRHVAPVRKEIGIRTIFNLLGPLTNPASADRQVIGVASPAALPLVAGALAALGCEHGLVVHSRDGLDEISLAGPCDAIEIRGESQQEMILEPASFGLEQVRRESLTVAGVEESAAAIRDVLAGRPGPRRDVVLANAAAALYVAGHAASPRDGVDVAREAVDSGAARNALDRLVAFTQRASAEAL